MAFGKKEANRKRKKRLKDYEMEYGGLNIKDSFYIGNYTVVVFDELPHKDFKNVVINGEKYEVVPVYDIQNGIALRGKFEMTNVDIQFI